MPKLKTWEKNTSNIILFLFLTSTVLFNACKTKREVGVDNMVGGSATFGSYTTSEDEPRDFNGVGINQWVFIHYEDSTSFLFGGNLFFGKDKGFEDKTMIAISPFARFNNKFSAFGFGGHLGAFSINGELGSGIQFYPQLDLRLGYMKYFYAEARIGDHFPSPFPTQTVKFGIGSGLGKTDGSSISVGLSNLGFYIEPQWVLENGSIVHPFIAYLDSDNIQIGFTFHYRFGGW